MPTEHVKLAAAAPSELSETLRRLRAAPRFTRAAIVAVFVLSLAIRVALALAATPAFVSDARDYRDCARNLAAGHGYMQKYEGETTAFNGYTFRAFRPPGYPVFLVALHAVFGWNDYAYLLPNIVADLVTQVCFLLIASHLFGVQAGLLVEVLLGLHVLWTPNPMTESLHTGLLAVLALLLVFGSALKTLRGALTFGLVAAAALFLRPVTICVFPALAWRWWRLKPSRRSTLLFLVTMVPSGLGLAAWTTRNYRLFGEFVLFTTNLGYHNAYDFGVDGDLAFSKMRAAGLNEAQINAALRDVEWQRARAHPLAWLVTMAERACSLFSLEPAFEVKHVLWELILNPKTSLVARLYRASYYQYCVTYALAGAGAVLLAMRRRGLCGLWALFFLYVLVHATFSRGDIRLVAPIYPVMCVFVGALWPSGWPGKRTPARPSASARGGTKS